jgi:cell wall-associated NlpC family hydrolase
VSLIDSTATALAVAATAASANADLDLSELTLDWVSGPASRDIDARGSLTGVTLERTIEGASTVTVNLRDPNGVLFRQGRVWAPKTRKPLDRDSAGVALRRPVLRGRAMEIELDGVSYRLVQVSKSGDDITLTFEDRSVYFLRRKYGAKRTSRSDVTRAQFILGLVREIKSNPIRFVCPELNVRQPIDKGNKKPVRPTTAKTRPTPPSGGIPRNAALTVKGHKATPEQRRIGTKVLQVADALSAGPKASLALMEAVVVESEVRNLAGGDASSVGVLQLLALHGSVARRRDIEWVVTQFLTKGFTGRGGAIKLAKSGAMTAGQVAQAVQGSGHPERYDQVRAEASKWLDAYGGSGVGGENAEADAAGGGTYYKSYQFAREAKEDSWTAIQRLAGEVGWRAFMVGASLFYVSEEDLYRRKVAYALTPEDDALIGVDFDVDWGKAASELRLTVTVGRWEAAPGTIVSLDGFGPADGRWLVTAWRRDYFQPVAELTLRQPGKEKLEPAPETGERAAADSSALNLGDTTLADSSHVVRVARRVDAIDRKRQGYKWGGGHGSFNDPGGYDCSGFVSSCLHAGGMLEGAPQSTVGLQHWGDSGEGKYLTVWVKENGNPHMSHTFMVLNVNGRKRFAEAGGAESGKTGWHRPRSTAGFVARHWPGT